MRPGADSSLLTPSGSYNQRCSKRDTLDVRERVTPKLASPSLGLDETAAAAPSIDLLSLHAYSNPIVPWDPHLDDPDVVSKSDSAHWDQTRTSPFPQTPPRAPLLKDLDSFTEGTSVGSFDFSLPPSPSSPNIYYQLEPAPSLGPGPDPEDLTHAIETWMDGVIMSVVGPRDRLTLDEGNGSGCHGLRRGVKRHRSCTSLDGEWDERKLVRGRAGRMLLGVPACGPSQAVFVTP